MEDVQRRAKDPVARLASCLTVGKLALALRAQRRFYFLVHPQEPLPEPVAGQWSASHLRL